jgi:hypothetical protein
MNAPLGWVPGLRVNLLRWQDNAPKREPGGVDESGRFMAKRAPKKAIKQATNVPELAARVHAQALRRYGQAIFDAHKAYEAELERLAQGAGILVRDAHKTSPEYRTAQSILGKMGLAFQVAAKEGSFGEDGKRLFLRLSDALKPPVDARSSGHAVRRAVEIVDGYAGLFITEQESEHRSTVAFAIRLLSAQVHGSFSELRAKEPAVSDLFARYIESTPRAAVGRAPRKRKAGAAGALTAAGIVCELNKLARFPLGRRLTPDGVNHAIARQK